MRVPSKHVAQCELFTSGVICDVHQCVCALPILRRLKNHLLHVVSSRLMGGISPALYSQIQKGAPMAISSVVPGERSPCLFLSAVLWPQPLSSQPCGKVTGFEAGRRIPQAISTVISQHWLPPSWLCHREKFQLPSLEGWLCEISWPFRHQVRHEALLSEHLTDPR